VWEYCAKAELHRVAGWGCRKGGRRRCCRYIRAYIRFYSLFHDIRTYQRFGRPFRARLLVGSYPGLKPWAMLFSHFMAVSVEWELAPTGVTFRPFAPLPVFTALSSRLWRQHLVVMVLATVDSLE
jgi:hypothetical protein